MPLSKRCILDSHMYGPPDVFEESPRDTLLGDISMSGALGAIHQIRFLAMYTIEIFDNLTRLTQDVGDRIASATLRTNSLMSKMAPLERKVRSKDIMKIEKKRNKSKKFKSRVAIIPSTITKKTNSAQIQNQYTYCNIPPQLWKMETVIADDCVARYSHPGLFFEEWLKVEILKQEELKKEKKKAKEERKRAKEEKRRRRREDEENMEQGVSMSARDKARARTRQLKEEKRKAKEKQREEAEENKKRAAAALTARTAAISPPPPEARPVSIPHSVKMQEIKQMVSRSYLDDDLPPPPDDSMDSPSPLVKEDSMDLLPPPPDDSVDDLLPPEDDSFNMPPPDDSIDDAPPPDDDMDGPPPDDSMDGLPPPDDDSFNLPPPDEDSVMLPSSPGGDSLPPLPEDDDDMSLPHPPLDHTLSDSPDRPPSRPLSGSSLHKSPKVSRPAKSPDPPDTPPSAGATPPPMIDTPPPVSAAAGGSATISSRPIKSSGKAGRRRSLLDMKVDKGDVAAAAAENLKTLNLTSMYENDEEEEDGRGDDIKSVIAFAQDSLSAASPSVTSAGVSSGQKPVAHRLSIRSSVTGRRSSVGSSSRDSLVGRRPQPPPGGLERLSSMGRAAEEDERVYGATAAASAAETVAAMSNLAMLQTSYDPTDPPDPNAEPPRPHQQYDTHEVEDNEQQYGQDEYNYYNDGYNYDEYGNAYLIDEYGQAYYPDQQQYADSQGEGYYDANDVNVLPPEDMTPVHTRQQSALDISVLGQIKTGKVLRRAPPPPPKEKSTRDTVLDLIKDGGISLRKAEPIQKSSEQRHEAIAAILSNRAQIAGSDSDSDSDDSDSDYSDDSFFD